MATARAQIETVVKERAICSTLDDAADLRSAANAEQTIKSEYFGRFLIELLQNARDACMADPESRDGGGKVLIELTADDRLVVANQGSALSADLLLYSLGKFGESSKPAGEGIGHKGIGFKSVLEISVTPEIYSRSERDGAFDIAVRFDPRRAYALVRACTPNWDDLLDALPGQGSNDPLEAIPTLGFPEWVDQPPGDWGGFNTVVCLPHDPADDKRLGLTSASWGTTVRRAIADLSDEIVLLLGAFNEIEVRVHGAEPLSIIRTARPTDVRAGMTVTEVEILRNGEASSRWRLYERSLPGFEGLEGDMAVGVPLDDDHGTRPILPMDGPEAGAHAGCFHLFFPTLIPTNLPFLLHAYFEVNASRKGFAGDSSKRNRMLLDGLRELAVDTIANLADPRSGVDCRPLPDLFARAAGESSEPLARVFRDELLDALDQVAWVVVHPAEGHPAVATPLQILTDPSERVAKLLPLAFPSPYAARQAPPLFHPCSNIGPGGALFLSQRIARATAAATATATVEPGVGADTLAHLLRPGEETIWPDDADEGFTALARLLAFLLSTHPEEIATLIDGLRGDPAASIVPTVTGEGGRRLVHPPGQSKSEDERAGDAGLFARLRARDGGELTPPGDLDTAFLPDGLLDGELLAGPGARLGIREHTTNAVLDRFAAASRAVGRDADVERLRFVWRLLLRERDSLFGIRQTLQDATALRPGYWFWCVPGRARTDTGRTEQRRAQALAAVPLPNRNGDWRPATELAFGADWADWLAPLDAETAGESGARRAEWYRSLEAAAPSEHDLVAGPAELIGLLGLDERDAPWLLEDEAPPVGAGMPVRDEPWSEAVHTSLVHALLLRLGVWEVPPIEAVVDYRPRAEPDRDPWAALAGRQAHFDHIEAADGFRFGVVHAHGRADVHVGEDYRFRWPLELAATESLVLEALGQGVHLYEQFMRISLFCPTCTSAGHKSRQHNDDKGDRSLLAWQLHQSEWLPVSLDGQPTAPRRPSEAWWHPNPPQGAGIAQSPLRYLPIADPATPERLLRFADVATLDRADQTKLLGLLDSLRLLLEDGRDAEGPNPRTGSVEKQAFIGLHRLVYASLASKVGEEPGGSLSLETVLAEQGNDLVHVEPADARHDNGQHAGYRRHFLGQVPFVALAREQEPVAARLRVPRFELDVMRQPSTGEEEVTDEVHHLLHDRIDELMALLTFHAVGGPTLTLGSDAFRDRALRLSQLRVIRADDVVLDLTVRGTDLHATVGEGSARDLYLEGATTAKPILYHDLPGDDWPDQLRHHLAPHLAALVESPAYGATFALLLQYDSPAEREAWLLELGISDSEMDQVQHALQATGIASQEDERRWWEAVLPLLDIRTPLPADPTLLPDAVREGLEGAGLLTDPDSLGAALLRHGGTALARRNTEPDGPLARLEAAQIDLLQVHRELRLLGDRGLTVGVAERALRGWSVEHSRSVAYVLHQRGSLEIADAKRAPSEWGVPEDLRYRIDVDVPQLLSRVAATLHQSGIAEADATELAERPEAHLADLVGMTPAALAEAVQGFYDKNELARQLRECTLAWQRALVPVGVALRVTASEPAYRIRAEEPGVRALFPTSLHAPQDLASPIAAMTATDAELAELITSRLPAEDRLSLPDVGELQSIVAARVTGGISHVIRVREVLARGPRKTVDTMRARADDLDQAQVAPIPYRDSQPGPVPGPGPGPRKPVRPWHVKRDQRALERIGADGETWALAAVTKPLLELDLASRRAVLGEMASALRAAYVGEAIDELCDQATMATSTTTDEDDQMDALGRFLHLSRTSDMFGCDLLGWLSPYPGADPRPLFLEVKSTADRAALISHAEWRQAERLADAYAVLLVRRGAKNAVPTAMDLLPDPVNLFRTNKISLDPDTWQLAYQPADGN